MNPEDRIRNAYDDLQGRVARDVRPTADPSRVERARPALLGRPGLAIAGLVVAAGVGAAALNLAGGDDDQQVSTDSPTTTLEDANTASTVEDPTTDEDPADDGQADPDEVSPDDTADEDGQPTDSAPNDRFRVATELVSADTDDPFLNVRSDPDAGADLVAKLPATYTGLRATGQNETAADGGAWVEVELLHPVSIDETTIGGGQQPTGWVNRAFVEPLADGLPVVTDELAGCAPGAESAGTPGGLADGHVAALESGFVSDTCLRVVLTFGSGQAPLDWIDLPEGTGPATAVPQTTVWTSGGVTSEIDLGPIGSTWPEATETDDNLYLVRGDDGSLDLLYLGRARVAGVTARPDIGAVVIDLDVDGPASIPRPDAGIVPTAAPLVGGGTIELTGLARPFEAVVGVEILDAAGQPVEAVFSGNAQIGTLQGDRYGAVTTDWLSAWGRFAFRAEGLAAGDYTVVLNANDAADQPELFRLEVTLEDGGEAPTLATEAEARAAGRLISFAQGSPIDEALLADEVTLLLGPVIRSEATAGRLADPQAWTMDEPDGFAEFTGPFNPLSARR
ncbi:MAG: hypothetical protein AAFO29_11825, partial [Actinomycetota bacterium]